MTRQLKPLDQILRPFTEAQLSNGRLSSPLTEKELAPLESGPWEGSSLSSLLSEKTQDEKRREWETGRNIDLAFLDFQHFKGKGMDPEDWKFLRMFLVERFSR